MLHLSKPMNAHLLITKLHYPLPRSNLIPRPRLVERLNEGMNYPLTLISASAGFGKTTTLNAWIQQSKRPVAWVSLDEGDNDPARFWTYFIAALQTLDAHLGEQALAMLHAQGQPLPRAEPFLTLLLNDVAAFAEPLALVLDDYHVISAPEIHEGITFLVDHLPPQMHLYIASRSDPPLPLARWRARDQLTEIRADHLRLKPEEAATFLNQVMGLNLSAEDIRALEAHTEGWIAGLQLAALSIQGRDDAFKRRFVSALTGSQRYILEYLTDEVLRREPENIQTFLLQTSILDRLSAPLCNAVTGRVDSQEMLERLERANLFIVPLDAERRWYRYHPLFADVLYLKLQQTQPDRVPQLHRKAGAWCEAHQLIDDAVRHALAAGDTAWAAQLVEEHVNDVLRRGEGETLRRWLSSLPHEVLHTRPRLALAKAMVEFNAGRLELVEPLLADAEQALAVAPANSHEPLVDEATSALANVPAAIALLRASLAGYRGDAERMSELARMALSYLSEDERGPRYSVRWNLAIADWLRGRLAEAERAFDEIMAEGQAEGQLHMTLSAGSFLGRVQRAQGRLNAAFRTYQQGLEFASRADLSTAPSAGMAHLGMAEVYYERNELEQALRHATEGISLARQLTSTQSLASGLATLAWIRQAMRDSAAALKTMDEALQVLPNLAVVALQNPVPVERARLLLAQGNVSEAARWVEERGLKEEDELSYPQEREYLMLARVLLARHEPERALGLLERLGTLAQAQRRMESVIEARLLQALALGAVGDRARAMTTLAQAVRLAEPEGYVRIFVDEGEPLRFWILDFRLQTKGLREIEKPESARQLDTFVDRLILAFPRAEAAILPRSETLAPHAGAGVENSKSKILLEPLSERELEILRLIAAGRSTQEIAEELVIAVGTVRTHLKNIYGKLDAHSRIQAVERARALGFL